MALIISPRAAKEFAAVRQGDWRAVYSIENGDVIVERIGDRKVVYR